MHLTEDHLLPGFGRNGLQQHLRGGPRVHVWQETVHARLAPPCQFLAEVDELWDGLEGVLVLAAFGGVRTKHVADEGGVAWGGGGCQNFHQLWECNGDIPISCCDIYAINALFSAPIPVLLKSSSENMSSPAWNKSSSIHS